ncbi:MAG: YesL family protein [Clostridia bacterium]|nr:YesL family protein [Clostridia bacterium]
MAIRDLMNNYFYGKQGKGDFTIENLPKNRRELFFEVLKVRWSGLFGVNLLYMVFWLPAILWTAINLSAALNMMSREAGLTPEAFSGLVMTWLLILIPCITFTGPFNAGVTFVLRNWARDEHSFVLSDFKDAVKGNWKQALVISPDRWDHAFSCVRLRSLLWRPDGPKPHLHRPRGAHATGGDSLVAGKRPGLPHAHYLPAQNQRRHPKRPFDDRGQTPPCHPHQACHPRSAGFGAGAQPAHPIHPDADTHDRGAAVSGFHGGFQQADHRFLRQLAV